MRSTSCACECLHVAHPANHLRAKLQVGHSRRLDLLTVEKLPRSIAFIRSYGRDIVDTVHWLRRRGYGWPAIEGAVLWSEAEGRLSPERIRDRTRELTRHPERIREDWYL